MGTDGRFKELARSLSRLSGFHGFAIVSGDGLPLYSLFLDEVEAQRVAAAASSLVGTSEATVNHLDLGLFEVAVLRSKRRDLLCLAFGDGVIVVVLLDRRGNLRRVVHRAERIGHRVQDLMGMG